MDTIIIITIAITAIISYLGFQNQLLFEKYKFNVGSILHKKEYIRLLSAGFLHADWMHFALNMYVLFIFAPTIINGTFTDEGVMIKGFGVLGFLIIYLGSILLGNIFSLYLYKRQGWYSAIGASGGVTGILFAAISMNPLMGLYFLFIPIKIFGFIFGLLYFAYSVYSMLNPRQNDNTGHAAHLGGAFFGLVYAFAIRPEMAMSNALYIGIMALPLLYMAYEVFINKKIG